MFEVAFLLLLLAVSILPSTNNFLVKVANSNLLVQTGTEEEWRQFFRRVVGCDVNKKCSKKMSVENLAAWFERLLAKKNRKGQNLVFNDIAVSREFFGGSTFGMEIDKGILAFLEGGAKYTPLLVDNNISDQDLELVNAGAVEIDGCPRPFTREISPHDFAKLAVEHMKYPTEDEFISYVYKHQSEK